MKYCGSLDQKEGDVRVEHQCNCKGPNIHIANVGNYHFQSIVPINYDDSVGKSILNSSTRNLHVVFARRFLVNLNTYLDMSKLIMKMCTILKVLLTIRP